MTHSQSHSADMITRTLMALACLACTAFPTKAEEALLWRLVAQSDVVMVASVSPPTSPPPRTYVALPLSDVEMRKGARAPDEILQWYSEPQAHMPSIQQIEDAAGYRALIFALRVDGKLYFAGPTAFRIADPASVSIVEAEVSRQTSLLARWRPDVSVPRYAEVQQIIEAIIALPPASRLGRRNGENQQQALFDRLIALGPEAVPAIIEQMNDDRRLPHAQISLVNHAPDAFEGLRHYGPDLMVEALAAVLNQITGEHFGFIYNGGTEQQRAATVDGWRVYLDHLRTSDQA